MRKKNEKEQEKHFIIMCFDRDKERELKSAYRRVEMVAKILADKMAEEGEQPTAEKLVALLSVNRREIVTERKERMQFFQPKNETSQFMTYKNISYCYVFSRSEDSNLFKVLTGDKLERLKAIAFDKYSDVLSSCALNRGDLDLSVLSVDERGVVVAECAEIVKDRCTIYATERGADVLADVERVEKELNDLTQKTGTDALGLFRYSVTENKVKRVENVNYNLL